jgi:hypothetical protein
VLLVVPPVLDDRPRVIGLPSWAVVSGSVGETGDEIEIEIALSDGEPSVSGAVRIGDEVHRETGPWTQAVHGLLRHLEERGFDGAPRVLGFDDRGREVLSFVPGDSPTLPWPKWMMTDDALAGLGRLLRRYHDAVDDFLPPEDARWRSWVGAVGGSIIRHGDLWPSNVVFREGVPVALIDFDFAQPGTPLDDVVSAAKPWVPLLSDERAIESGWSMPLDRVRRLRILCDAYGLPSEERQNLLPTLIRNVPWGYESHKAWGEAGVPGFAEMWAEGSGAVIRGDLDWLEENRTVLEEFLRE